MHFDLEFTPGKRERVLGHHISRTGRPTKNVADGLPKHQWKPTISSAVVSMITLGFAIGFFWIWMKNKNTGFLPQEIWVAKGGE